MEFIFRKYGPDEPIPVTAVLRKRKLVKYYNREAQAAVLTAAEFLEGKGVSSDTPFYYASAETENFHSIRGIVGGIDSDIRDICSLFPAVSTLDIFKMMRNMVPCFIAIENDLKGDNNVIIDSASALLYCALTAPTEGNVLIGAGRLRADGSVECGFALGTPSEWNGHPFLGSGKSATEIFELGEWRQ